MPCQVAGILVGQADNHEAARRMSSFDAYMRVIVRKELIDIVWADAALRLFQGHKRPACELDRTDAPATLNVF
jgi:hypothetical protein